MKRLLTVFILSISILLSGLLSGCTSDQQQMAGTAGGALLGGLAGSAIGGGSTAATIGGAVVGGVIGNQVTKPNN